MQASNGHLHYVLLVWEHHSCEVNFTAVLEGWVRPSLARPLILTTSTPVGYVCRFCSCSVRSKCADQWEALLSPTVQSTRQNEQTASRLTSLEILLSSPLDISIICQNGESITHIECLNIQFYWIRFLKIKSSLVKALGGPRGQKELQIAWKEAMRPEEKESEHK